MEKVWKVTEYFVFICDNGIKISICPTMEGFENTYNGRVLVIFNGAGRDGKINCSD